jgi:hypothetical protein
MKIEYVPKKFAPPTLGVIRQAEAICQQYQAQGYDLTLRQLYYQFVARGLIPNKDTEYKRLGNIINDARLAGQLDWDFIVDRTRNLRSLAHWDGPTDLVDAASQQFRTDKWSRQPTRVEVWIEKDALVGVLDTACPPYDVPYFSCRGYTSQSEIWGAAQRLNQYLWAGQNVIILHLGDHDPSGVDMTRDIKDRLKMFTEKDGINHLTQEIIKWREQGTWPAVTPEKGTDEYQALIRRLDDIRDSWGQLEVRRIALTMDQVQEYDPPPNPAKMTDARANGYIDVYGDESWELDALDPATLTTLIQDEIEDARDDEQWDQDVEEEEDAKTRLARISEHWDDLNAWLDEQAS